MERHTHAKRAQFAPVGCVQVALRGESGSECIDCSGEDRVDAIASLRIAS